MRPLIIIPARGGSKGIPHKNIKELGGKPLICRTIDVARGFAPDADICVSTDDPEIARIVEDYGLKVPFMRPDYLALDTAGTYEVLLHALDFYESRGEKFDCVLLLQPTSPFRRKEDVAKALEKYDGSLDMVVSVKETSANPYYNCFEEDASGMLHLSKGDGTCRRRQDAPKAYEYNGAVYVINPASLKLSPLSKFKKIKPSVMDDLRSLDLDTMLDWKIAELLIKENMV